MDKDQDAFAQGVREGIARKCGGSEEKYTKLPWVVNAWSTGRWTVETPEGLVIAEIHQTHEGGARKANAKFICNAVNSHDQLVEALKGIVNLEVTCGSEPTPWTRVPNIGDAKTIATGALKAAGEEV